MEPQLTRFIVKVADSRELVQSLQMREISYREFFHQGGGDLHDSNAVQFVVCSGNEVVAGARMIGPTPVPLEIPVVLHLSPEGRARPAIAQLGGLWLHPRYRRVTVATAAICRKLFHKVYETGRRLGASGFILRTSERRMTKWYGALGFVPVPEWDYHDPVWGKVFTMFMPLHPDPSIRWPERGLTTARPTQL